MSNRDQSPLPPWAQKLRATIERGRDDLRAADGKLREKQREEPTILFARLALREVDRVGQGAELALGLLEEALAAQARGKGGR